MLSRLIYGARISLVVGFVAILIAMVIGSTIGIVAGYIGGRFDQIVMGLLDVMLSFPTLLLGLMIAAMLGASLENLIIAIAITEIAPFARVARAPTISLKQRDFVEAGRALGFGPVRIMGVHILPNMISDVVVMSSLWMASAIRTEASLSFIGLGVPPPTPTWGSMIREGFENILDAWWLAVFPSLAILADRARAQPARRRACATRSIPSCGRSDAHDRRRSRHPEPAHRIPHRRRAGIRPCATCRCRWRRTRRSPSSANPAAARASPRCRSCACCRRPARASARGELLFEGRDLAKLSEREMSDIRGNAIAMIFQEPMTSLNPTMTVGEQIAEAITIHRGALAGRGDGRGAAAAEGGQDPVGRKPHRTTIRTSSPAACASA